MSLTRILATGAVIGLVSSSLSGCVVRECTEEERDDVGADGDDTCHKVVPLKTFTDEAEHDESVDWEAGDNLRIEGDVREIEVMEGSGDEVTVTYQAQVDLASDRSDEVVIRTMRHLTHSLEKDVDTIVVSSDRGESDSNLGSIVEVRLPPEFDGDITIDIKQGRPGPIDLDFIGAAQHLEIDKDSLGALRIASVRNLRSALINTNGEILTGTFGSEELDQVVIHTELGNIETSFSNPPGHSATVVADLGDVTIALPDDGDYEMQVAADDGVSLSGVPGACTVDDDEPDAQSMTCNAGDPDRVTFKITASGEASIDFI